MELCDSERCVRCEHDEGSAACFRRHAQSCLQVAKSFTGEVKEGMELLAFAFMEDAAALDRRNHILSAPQPAEE